MNNQLPQNNQTAQIDALYSLLEHNRVRDSNLAGLERSFDVDFSKLPKPVGVPQKYLEAVSAPITDDALYSYKVLAEKLEREPVLPKVPTFFKPIDDLLDGGFQGGELVTLSGFTKGGKSTLMQTLSFLQAQKGIATVLFTLEMGWQEFTRKFIAMDAVRYTDLPLWYPIDNRALSLKWLEMQIEKAIVKNKVRMAYIDHLHFLLPLKDYRQNVSFLVGGVVRELKKIAVKLDIPIMLIAHTRKLPVEGSPDLSSIRDSGFIACESDFTFLIWRVRENENKIFQTQGGIIYKDESWVSLEANRRNGRTLKFKIYHKNNRFYDEKDYNKVIEEECKMNEAAMDQFATIKAASSIFGIEKTIEESSGREIAIPTALLSGDSNLAQVQEQEKETPWFANINDDDD